jgi:hypothetical protein
MQSLNSEGPRARIRDETACKSIECQGLVKPKLRGLNNFAQDFYTGRGCCCNGSIPVEYRAVLEYNFASGNNRNKCQEKGNSRLDFFAQSLKVSVNDPVTVSKVERAP